MLSALTDEAAAKKTLTNKSLATGTDFFVLTNSVSQLSHKQHLEEKTIDKYVILINSEGGFSSSIFHKRET